jgi:glycosyltransferase involved in cell wall biosynthesis
MDKIKQIIQKCELKHIELSPATNRIEQEYRDSAILALSSRYEGFGLVLIEANACGIPCVAMTCHCGPRDIIKDGENGLLVPEGDIQSMASALSKLMEDDDLRYLMGRKALEMSKRYSLPVIMSRWDKLFKELVAK